jgi:2'-hydroxyisoflavone reductase
MKLLVLGGTVFLGRHLAEAALARGHEVTLFNRGRHHPELFPEAEKLRGDRDGGLAPLRGRRWDAAVDTSGQVPRLVRAAAELLADAVDHYTLVSTLAVYADFPRLPGIDERFPLAVPDDPAAEEVSFRTVGPLKALCERAAEAALPGRVLAVRAGLLAGPHDPTDRFTYWPRRVARGGEVLAPAGPGLPVQFVDARDLAAWMVGAAESRLAGAYNATGPARPLTLGELLEACREESRSDARFTWVDERSLLRAGVGRRLELPLWLPGAPGAAAADCRRALAAGLAFRPLAETVRDTRAWDAARPPEAERRAGLSREREAELLRALRAAAAEPVLAAS